MHQAGLQQRGRGGGGGGYSNQKLNFKIHGGSCPTQHDNSKFPGPPPPKPSFRNSSFDCARRDPEGPQFGQVWKRSHQDAHEGAWTTCVADGETSRNASNAHASGRTNGGEQRTPLACFSLSFCVSVALSLLILVSTSCQASTGRSLKVDPE